MSTGGARSKSLLRTEQLAARTILWRWGRSSLISRCSPGAEDLNGGTGSPAVPTATATAVAATATAGTSTAAAVATATTGAAAAAAAAAIATAAAGATAAAAAITAAATTTTTTTAFTGGGLVDADHATHPFDVLEVIDGFLLGGIVGELHEGKATLSAGFAVEGEAALADFAVLAEKIKQVFAFSLEREVADVDGHSLKSLELIRLMLGYPGKASERRRPEVGALEEVAPCGVAAG
jgi:hypothetical protein